MEKSLHSICCRSTRREFLAGAAAFSAASAPNLSAMSPSRPKLVLGVMSDTHITDRASALVLERTLKFFRARKVDAVVNCGDLSDWGLLSGLKYVEEAWERVFPGGKGDSGRPVGRLFCTGNHDYEGWWYGDMTVEMHALGYSEDEALVRLGMKKCWEEVFQEEFAPVRHKRLNGFDFVCAEWHGHDRAPGFDQAPAWLKAHAGDFDPSRPFFYFMHPPMPDTTAGSYEDADCRAVEEALAVHPRVVAFSGHSHWPLTDERSIWQGAFTALAVPSLSCTGVPGGYENGSDVRNGKSEKAMPIVPVRFRMERPQAMVVSVYDGHMEVERYDCRRFVAAGPSWSVPLPVAEGAKPYSFKAHAARTPVPEFPAGAEMSISTRNTETRGGKWEIAVVVGFPSATATESARAFDYELRAVPADGAAPTVKRFLSPAFHKPQDEEPENVVFWFNALELPQDVEYRIEVYPRNCFGACGRPLVSAPRRGKPGGAHCSQNAI